MTSMSFRRCFSRNIHLPKRAFSLLNYPQSIPYCANSVRYIQRNEFLSLQPKLVNFKMCYSRDEKKKIVVQDAEPDEPKPGLIKRFKQMYRDYWYVLVPVHLVTSAGWFGGFYYLAKSGVDVVALLQSMGLSETFTTPFKDSSMGYLAISYALYKIATPFRYTVTLGGTTISINYLKNLGYIKPIPSKDRMKEMYIERRDHFRETIEETKEELRQRKDQLKERKDNIMGDYVNFKKELKDIKTK